MLFLPFADTSVNLLTIFTIGLIAGVTGGVFGNFANSAIVPVLHIFGLPLPISVSAGASLDFGRTSLSFITGRDDRLAYRRIGITSGLIGLLGVYLGFKLHMILKETSYGTAFIEMCYPLILMAGAVTVFLQWKYFNRNHYYDVAPFPAFGLNWRFPLAIPGGSGLSRVTVSRITLVGMLLGITTGMLGLGAGVLGISLFMYILGLPPENATATDAIAMSLIGSGTIFLYAAAGQAEFLLILILILAVTVGCHIGAALPGEMNQSHARLLFSASLAIVALAALLRPYSATVSGLVIQLTGIALCGFIIINSLFTQRVVAREKRAAHNRNPV
ncbi:MAG: sulfite exporter TauE/SafE family protein [Bacillota bacterium]